MSTILEFAVRIRYSQLNYKNSKRSVALSTPIYSMETALYHKNLISRIFYFLNSFVNSSHSLLNELQWVLTERYDSMTVTSLLSTLRLHFLSAKFSKFSNDWFLFFSLTALQFFLLFCLFFFFCNVKWSEKKLHLDAFAKIWTCRQEILYMLCYYFATLVHNDCF